MLYRAASAVAVLSFAVVSQLGAQACVGAASFASGPVRIGAGLNVADNAKSYGLQMAAGSSAGPFATATLSRAEYNEVDDAGIVLGVNAGYAIDLTPEKNVQFCPLVGFAYQTGPDVSTTIGTISTSAHAVAFGGSLGGIVPVSPMFDFVPFAGGSYLISQASASTGGASVSNAENYGEINVGAGFVINRILTLQPSVSVPVGLDGGKTSFQIAFAFNFGASSRK